MSGMSLSASTDNNDTVSTPSKRHRCPAVLSTHDQRQIQAADAVGSAGRTAALWRDQKRPPSRRRRNEGDHTRVLSRELKALAQSGLIVRKDFGGVPPKVEYRLSQTGRSFIPVIGAIRDWGTRHLRADHLRVAS
jgi:DNA-binding HxlR family transcriptional regulator